VHWFSGYDHPRSVAANGGVYVWKDGRTNADTFTAVFDYGPDDDKNKGFQVVYHSRMHNGAAAPRSTTTPTAACSTWTPTRSPRKAA
jgi:hypothetical protein